MKQRYVAQGIRTTTKYLTVQVRIEHGSTVRWAEVKVPWRLLNEQYEKVANAMSDEANEQVSGPWAPATVLPLEVWE